MDEMSTGLMQEKSEVQKVPERGVSLDDIRRTEDDQVPFAAVLVPDPDADLCHSIPISVQEYWPKREISGLYPLITYVEHITDLFLDINYRSTMSDHEMSIFFQTLTSRDKIPYKISQSHHSYDFFKLRNAAVEITIVLDGTESTPDLQKYINIVKILKKLPAAERMMVQSRLEKKIGPIVALASNVNLQNVYWFLGKLKPNNSFPLIDQIFTSPTILGKMNAIWKLLELYDILWQGIDWSMVQSIVQFLYKVLDWLMEKCNLAKEFCKTRFKWIKAKKFTDGIEKQAFDDPTAPELQINDCLYTALAPQFNSSPQRFKKEFLAWLKNFSQEEYEDLCALNGSVSRAEQSLEEVKNIADSELMLTDIHVLLISQFKQTNILVKNGNEEVLRDNAAQRLSSAEPKYLYHWVAPEHWDASLPCGGRTISILGTGNEYVHKPKTCECTKPVTCICIICGTRKCLNCVATCCGSIISKTPSLESLISTDDEAQPVKPVATVTPVKPVVQEPSTPSTVERTTSTLQETWHTIVSFFESLDFNEFATRVKRFLENLFTNIYEWLQSNPLALGLASCIAAISTLLGFSIPVLSNEGDKRSIITKLSDATRSIYYFQRSTTGIVENFKEFGEAMASVLGISTDAQVTHFKDKVLEITQQAEKMLELSNTNPAHFVNSSEQMHSLEVELANIDKVYSDMIKLSSKANMSTINPVWQALNKVRHSLQEVNARLKTCTSKRQEPVVLWLWGPTNIGKSRLLNYITEELNRRMGTEMSVFTVSKGPEYWNSFCGQSIIKIDDFGSWVGAEGNTDALVIFNLKTTAAYNPNLAALSEKTTMAAPKFVIVASNHPTVSLNSGVTDLTAWERRRDFFVRVDWPGHELCAQEGDCEHLKKVRQEYADTKRENFSHLKLTECLPNITQIHNVRGKMEGVVKPLDEVKAQECSIDSLITKMITKEQIFREQFEVSFNGEILKQSIVSQFVDYPNYMIAGPPGTGKSFILGSVKTSRAGCFMIETKDEFENFANAGFVAPDATSMVILDDLSTHVSSEKFDDLLQKIKERSDQQDPKTIPWVMGVNLQILKPRVEQLFGGADNEEAWDMFLRRNNLIETKIKKTLTRLFKRPTPQVIADHIKKGKPIEEYVAYNIGSEKKTQHQVIDLLSNIQVKVVDIASDDVLKEEPLRKPDAYIKMDITSDELVELVNRTVVSKIMQLLSSDKITISPGKHSTRTILLKVKNAISNAGSHFGIEFDTADEFMLECNNSRFLQEFGDQHYYLILLDKIYSIHREGGDVKAFLVNEPVSAIGKFTNDCAELAKVVKAVDFVSMTASEFSPWICFAGDLIAMISKIGLSALSISHSVSSEREASSALRILNKAKSNAHLALEREASKLANLFSDTHLDSNTNRGGNLYSISMPGKDKYTSLKETESPVTRSNRAPVRPSVPPKRETSADARRAKDVDKVIKGDLEREITGSQKGSSTDILYNLKTEYDSVGGRHSGHKTVVKQSVLTTEEFSELVKEDVIPVAQSCADPDLLPSIDKISRNCVRILNRNGKHICHGLVIKDFIMTTVHHIRSMYQIEDLIVEDIHNNRYTCTFYQEIPGEDMLDLKLHPVNSAAITFSDITRHLASPEYTDYEQMSAVLLTVSRMSSKEKNPLIILRTYTVQRMLSLYDDDVGTMIRLIKYMGYKTGMYTTDVITRPGDCGSVLLVSDPNYHGGKILGLHSRATDVEAFIRPIFNTWYINPIKEILLPGKFMKEIIPVENEEHIAVTSFNVHNSGKTKLFRNICPIGEKKYEPSLLTPQDTRNPGHDMLEVEAKKWLIKPPTMSAKDKNLYRTCVIDEAKRFIDVFSREHKKIAVLTKTEALNKYRFAVHSEPIPTRTSPGYPWNFYSKSIGKSDYIKVNEKTGVRCFKKSPQVDKLHAAIDRLKNHCIKGEDCEIPLFQVVLKDEAVKLKNVYDTPKTRTIAACPLHMSILMRQYTHAGISSATDCHMSLPPAVGIDPTSAHWDMMWRQATNVGKDTVAMDYKGWDFTVLPFEIEMLALFWNTLYHAMDPNWKQEDDKVRSEIYKILSEAYIIVHNKVYQIAQGMMSGIPSTSYDNSLINTFRKRFSWKKIFLKSRPSIVGSDYFNRYVYLKCYGDDFFMVVMKSLVGEYNALTIRDVEESVFGVTLTSPDKEKEIVSTMPLHDVTFMSRHFKIIGDRCFGALEWVRVLKPTWWVHDFRSHQVWKDPDTLVSNLTNAFSAYESALMESVVYGVEKFNSIREPAQREFSRLGFPKTLPDYETMYAELQGVPPPDSLTHGIEIVQNVPFLAKAKIKKPKIPEDAKNFGNRISWNYGPAYSYRGVDHPEKKIPSQYEHLLRCANHYFGRCWNSLLFNYYPPGGCIPAHKDDEPCVDQTQGVGCLTVYGDGTLMLTREGYPPLEVLLNPNDFYIMDENCLKLWKHRRYDHSLPTMSITFRRIVPSHLLASQ
ncbi:hypothetical protein 1 [Hubei picorna-like virus 69]|uniref:hypothetical protein 1 n=1 Tax=Hubei picorna-like virus 69 TaxID=1923152 RepID=UPI00090BF976|nr:hypothetical protein 1 [Hubei picorna-like virus 69]APG78384.1 hypothetical protein 1 [Hubei picorna-like virus 69]